VCGTKINSFYFIVKYDGIIATPRVLRVGGMRKGVLGSRRSAVSHTSFSVRGIATSSEGNMISQTLPHVHHYCHYLPDAAGGA
jgi:hypothetical protein